MRKYRLGIEMDGALTQTDSYLKTEEARFGQALSFSHAAPRSGSREALHELAKAFQIVVISTGVMSAPDHLTARLAWLKHYFTLDQGFDVVCCSSVQSLDLDIFVSVNIHDFRSYNGQGIGF